MFRLLVFGVGLLACGGASEGGAADVSCEDASDARSRDVCLYEALLEISPSDSQKVVEVSGRIQDPVIQSAGVLEWIAKHNKAVPLEEGTKLCQQLKNWERTACERRLYAAHLQR